APDPRAPAHVAGEEVEIAEGVRLLERTLGVEALLAAARTVLLGQAELAAVALAGLPAHRAVGVALGDHHQLARAEELLVHLAEGDVVGVARVEQRRPRRRVADLQE